jgi:hypothetical protein
MKRSVTLLGAVAAVVGVLATGGPAGGSTEAVTVADTDAEYIACGRVFPDPHAYWPGPAPPPDSDRSPFAKGNAGCNAADFISYSDMISGMTYMETLFPQFLDFIELEQDFGTNVDCTSTTVIPPPTAYCSAGLPRQGVPTPDRVRSDLYMVRVTDERVPDTDKKFFVFPLSIHGIERAGAEAGVRAAEDLATWGWCEARQNNGVPPYPNALVNPCTKGLPPPSPEGTFPHRLLEAQPAGPNNLTAGDALSRSVIYFVFANPDGWRRGDPDNIARFFMRYNGNGVDMNRDWPTVGFTNRPYTPWSEPETRGFGHVLKQIKPRWDGGIDLHGQLADRAFSFTLMGASERNYGKDQRILQVVKGAWVDAEARLSWSPQIIPNDAPPPDCVRDPVLGVNVCPQMYGVQWGTVWDTINYTVTGAFGDWIDSDFGLGGDGIDNEMSFSHLINCGVGTCYQPDWEQLHVDGNKSLVYAMVNFSLLPEDTNFEVPGKVGYLFNPTVRSHPGDPTPPPPPALDPQPNETGIMLSPANNYTYQFTVRGPNDTPAYYNGGLEAKLTQFNVGGISGGSVASLVLEQMTPEPFPEPDGCPDTTNQWTEVNRYFNQASTYAQAGQAVHADSPEPGQWRVCLSTSTTGTLSGLARLDINFSGEKIWEDPGQLPYSATNMKFFTDLGTYMQPGQLTPVNAADVLSGATSLGNYHSFVIADDALAGVPAGQAAAWGTKLREYVQGGGNLVLTDGALQALGPSIMNVVSASSATCDGNASTTAVDCTNFYAGHIAFTSNGGANETYTDPLAAEVDQPGAAEGSGHRHQTYEPVPIGMDIGSRTSCSGSNCTAPIWTVAQTSWTSAGGRVVGQSQVNNRVAFGELPLGQGQIRIIGALIPMPTEQYYHPYGLANYAVTYSGYQVLKNTLQVDVPTSVRVSSFRAKADARRGVTVTWRAASNFGALGYNVWRFAKGKGVRVNRAFIRAKPAERAGGATYQVVDRSTRRGTAYTYRLQIVRANGTRVWSASSSIRAR